MPAHLSVFRPIVAAVLSGVLLAAGPAAAEEGTLQDAVRAAEHFRRGGTLYGEGRYGEALAEYERAHELAPHAANLFNMARCHENLGQASAALARYRDALESTESPAERADIERRIAAILARPVRVFVTSEPPGAEVLVDARPAPEPGRTPTTVELVPGAHRLLLRAEGHVPTPFRLEVAPGHQEPVSVALTPVRREPCPECPAPSVVERCRFVDLDGLHAHLSLSFPIGIPIVHREAGVQLLAGVGFRASLTRDRVIVGGRVNLHPYRREEDVSYSMFFAMLEAGYAWPLQVAVLRLTGGVAVLSDFYTSSDEHGRDLHTNNSLFGTAGAGLDVYALRWLSLGIDGTIAVGGTTDGQLELVGVVEAALTFHL